MKTQIYNNREGFTLIELLAVIVILGILMITAIPAVSNSITKSRKDTYVDNAKKVVDAVRTSMASGEARIDADAINTTNGNAKGSLCQYPSQGKTTVINLFEGGDSGDNGNILPYLLERGGRQSSFGQSYKSGYVIIENKGSSGDYYDYYVSLVDAGGNGIDEPQREDLLSRTDIDTSKSGLTASRDLGDKSPIQYVCEIEK